MPPELLHQAGAGEAQPPVATPPPAPQRPHHRPEREEDERSLEDRLTMTDQMEPVDDATKYRRKIDESLARFSAAHDELEAEERRKRQRRQRLLEQTMTAFQRVVPVGPKSHRRNNARRNHTDPDDDGESERGGLVDLEGVAGFGGPEAGAETDAAPDDVDSDGTGSDDVAGPASDDTELVRLESEETESDETDSDGDGSNGANGLRTTEADDTGSAGTDSDESTSDQDGSETRDHAERTGRDRRAVLASKAAVLVVAVLVFLGTGIGWGAKTWFEGQVNEILALDEDSADIRNASAQIGDANFLIVGSDTREGAEAEDNVGSTESIQGARSDTVMLAHIPEDRERVVVISFPRDLEITRPECQRWDSATGAYGETVGPAEAVKLNTAFTIGGPRCLTKVIQQISGVRINHFVGIDFQGFKGMVDAVGGVTMHFEEPMRDAELGLIVAETGDVLLKGEQALSFVRARKVYGDPTFSDYGRMKRQQDFLASLLRKVLSGDVLLDMGKLTNFAQAFARSTFGENIGVDQMLTLAQSMKGLDAGKVTFLTIPTVGEANERGNEVLLESEAAKLFQALIDNTPLPGEEEEQQGAPTPEAGAETGTPQQAAAPVGQALNAVNRGFISRYGVRANPHVE